MLNSYVVLSIAMSIAAAAGPVPQNKHQDAAPGMASEAKSAPGTAGQGKSIYARDCAICHGDDGKGQTDLAKGMQLTLDDWSDPKTLSGKSDRDLMDLIRAGKDKMPAEPADRAGDEALKDIVRYIRGFSKTPAAGATGEPAR